MKPAIIVISGLSGSGKDTFHKELVKLAPEPRNSYDFVNIKFSRPLKDFMEYCYSLPYEFLDDPVLRLQKPSKLNLIVEDVFTPDKTYLKIMTDLYLVWSSTDPTILCRPTVHRISTALKQDRVACITDARSPVEAEVIIEAAQAHNVPLIQVCIERLGLAPYASDDNLKKIRNRLESHADINAVVFNPSDLNTFQNNIKQFYDTLLMPALELG